MMQPSEAWYEKRCMIRKQRFRLPQSVRFSGGSKEDARFPWRRMPAGPSMSQDDRRCVSMDE
jgi:hypothetical protein